MPFSRSPRRSSRPTGQPTQQGGASTRRLRSLVHRLATKLGGFEPGATRRGRDADVRPEILTIRVSWAGADQLDPVPQGDRTAGLGRPMPGWISG